MLSWPTVWLNPTLSKPKRFTCNRESPANGLRQLEAGG